MGGYESTPAVPLKPPFFLPASVKCLSCVIVTIRDSIFSCFSRLVRSKFSFVVFLSRFLVKMAVFYVSRKQSVDNRNFKTLLFITNSSLTSVLFSSEGSNVPIRQNGTMSKSIKPNTDTFINGNVDHLISVKVKISLHFEVSFSKC